MRQRIIDLLVYPRWLVLDEIDSAVCPHQGYYNDTDPECRHCELGEACRWLSSNDAFVALTRTPIEDLLRSLEFAVDYVRFRCSQHNRIACVCESCIWLRKVRRFQRQYEVEGFESIKHSANQDLNPSKPRPSSSQT